MTDRLYEVDAYCSRFEAVVCKCERIDGKYAVVLDQTAFFPEGGGQAADKGTIQGIPVVDVQLNNSIVTHILESELRVGEQVICELDWELRFSRMQSHTGEHILSGVVNSLYGYDNVGFHMGDSSMQVDFNGRLTADDIKKIELAVNKAIYMNAEIVVSYPSKEELMTMHYRSKIDPDTDALRIVTIGKDIDCCACCAPHVARTGEVGIIKVIDFYPYKQGTRVELLAGKNALLDYMNANVYIKDIMKITSSPRDGVVDAVQGKVLLYQDLRDDYQRVTKELAWSKLKLIEVGNSVYSITEKLNFEELRYCSNCVMDGRYSVCLLLSRNDNEYIYVLCSKSKDIQPLTKLLNDAFGGKGGGKREYSQGKLPCISEREIIDFINNNIEKEV